MAETKSPPAPPSEWGKLNAGQAYGILAVDVDRAIAVAGFSEHEQVLLQAVREASWGTSARRKRKGGPWPDAEPARLDVPALARELGVPFQRLYAARARLLRAWVLVAAADGGLLVNKSAHEWIRVDPRTGRPVPGPDGKPTPRLSPAKLVYAAAARSRKDAMTTPPEFTDRREESSRASVNPDSRTSVNAIHAQPLIAFTDRREDSSRASVNPPIEKHARGIEILDLIQTGGEAPPPTHSIPIPVEAASPALKADPAPDPAAVARLVEKAQRLTADPAYGMAVFRHAPDWRLDWLERAVEETAGAGTSDFRYTLGILRGYKARGGPRAAPAGRSAVPAPEPRSAAYEYVRPEPPVPPEEAARRRAALDEFMGRFKAPMFAPDATRARRRDLA